MAGNLWQWQFGASAPNERHPLELSPVSFSDLPGWAADDHSAAFSAFKRSAPVWVQLEPDDDRILAIVSAAAALPDQPSAEAAKQFFETHFQPHRVASPGDGAIVTGYYEPELDGSLEVSDRFNIPVYALPDDLALIAGDDAPLQLSPDLTAARKTADGLVPYPTRREIEQGALARRGLEIAYLSDAADAFVMHVQGSGAIRLPNGERMHVAFCGKNGHPYTSIGKLLVERGELDPSNASLDALLAWIRADAERGRALMWENESYIFFRRLDEAEAGGVPLGALGVPLSPGRSLAVDPRFHRHGIPIWVDAPELQDQKGTAFHRLMVAQDTGSAIRGPVRGDIFWGTGAEAGRVAGATKHSCDFCILIPH